ncbi:MAG: hypothetical protein MJZ68_01615 [archaeon]|nr:hypothetical protein [archaeon]
MGPSDAIQLISVLFVTAVLSISSYMDIRYRTVPDRHWLAVGTVGPVGSFLYRALEDGIGFDDVVVLASCVLMTVFILTDNGPTVVCGAVAGISAFAVLAHGCDPYTFAGALSVIFGFLYMVLYYFGIVRGGADAKLLITVGMSFPAYVGLLHTASKGILEVLFVPSLSMLYTGAIVAVLYCVTFFLWINRGKKGLGLRRLVSGSLPLEKAERSFVWATVDIMNGVLVPIRRYEDDQGELYRRLKAYRVEDVPVTPMVPFILPLTIAFIINVTVGDPLSLLDHWLSSGIG